MRPFPRPSTGSRERSALEKAEDQLGVREAAVRNGDLVSTNKIILRDYEFDLSDKYTFSVGGDRPLFDLEMPNPDGIER